MNDSYIPANLPGLDIVIFTSLKGSNYIYTTVPKVACQSIAQIIGKAELGYVLPGGKDPNMLARTLIPTISRAQLLTQSNAFRDYFKFTFVRHPRERVRSFYFGSLDRPQLLKLPKIGKAESFEHYLEILLEIDNINTIDIHLLQQIAILYESALVKNQSAGIKKTANITYDYIGHLETCDDDWDYIHDATGVHFDRSFNMNKSRFKRELTSTENKLLDKVVQRHYMSDLEEFGYD